LDNATQLKRTKSTIPMLKPLAPLHAVQIRHRVGALNVDVDFTLTKRWTILFGPSGSGKTTILRIIAGLVRPDHARIVSTVCPGTDQERSFTFVDTEAGVFLPPHKRVVRLAPQQAALFPHLTALENMKYGMHLFVRDDEEASARDKIIANLLTSFNIQDVAGKRASELSGGEAQRVNLARAVATGGGRLLMLDEPFSGLDVALRDDLIANLLRRQNDHHMPQTLSVTHDVAEAFQLGAEVIKLADGRVVAQGPVEVVLAEERKRLLSQLGSGDGQIASGEPYLSG
jgi:molybdate transport system ATP-binding protein